MKPTLILKQSVNWVLGMFDLHLGRKHPPFIVGNYIITGSFPPYQELHRIGSRENYFIHDGYHHRKEYLYYDDTSHSDGYQDEVYRYAREVAELYNLQTIVDIGCGSGYKLLKYFHDRDTIASVNTPKPATREHLKTGHLTITPD